MVLFWWPGKAKGEEILAKIKHARDRLNDIIKGI